MCAFGSLHPQRLRVDISCQNKIKLLLTYVNLTLKILCFSVSLFLCSLLKGTEQPCMRKFFFKRIPWIFKFQKGFENTFVFIFRDQKFVYTFIIFVPEQKSAVVHITETKEMFCIKIGRSTQGIVCPPILFLHTNISNMAAVSLFHKSIWLPWRHTNILAYKLNPMSMTSFE